MYGELMAEEILQQPQILDALAARAAGEEARVRAVIPAPLAGVVFLARGSSDNAAVFGRYLAELTAGRPAGLAAPSIYTRYHAAVDWRGYLVIAISQSGSTPEIVSACHDLRTSGAVIISVTNEPDSPLARAADVALETGAGPERAIPATKTVTAQLLLLIAATAALGKSTDPGPLLHATVSAVSAITADPGPAKELAERLRHCERLVITGRGLAYAAALETALKVKETTGILAEGISAADLRHGPIAVAYAGAPVLLINAGGPAAADIRQLQEILISRDAQVSVLPLTPKLSELPEPAQVVAAVARGQQLAHALALAKGADPDQPIGLTKVTETT